MPTNNHFHFFLFPENTLTSISFQLETELPDTIFSMVIVSYKLTLLYEELEE